MTEKEIIINGIPIYVKLYGQGNNTILFLHGNSCNHSTYDTQLNDPFLQKNFQLIAFDLPGHGKSGKADNYRTIDIAQLIPDLINQLGIHNYILVGVSYSTCLISEIIHQLKNCKGCFFLGAGILNDTYTPDKIFYSFAEINVLAEADPLQDHLKAFASRLFFDKKSPLIHQYLQSYSNTDPAFRETLKITIASSDWTDEADNIKKSGIPVCFVFGKEDEFIKYQYLEDFPSKWGLNIFLIENAGHFANAEQPERFNSLLRKFAGEVF